MHATVAGRTSFGVVGALWPGEELEALEASIHRGLREFRHFIIDLGGVDRLDSTGIIADLERPPS